MANSGVFADKYLNWLEQQGHAKPQFASHGITDDDMRSKMTQLRPKEWRQEGNWIIGDTELGELRLSVGTDHKLRGTNTDGTPDIIDISKL